MSKEELVELYLDWALGRDDEISMSDVIYACYESGFDYDEIEKIGTKRI